ncbi:MAG: nucleotidyltransferase family protein [Paracoccaceae bacterium]
MADHLRYAGVSPDAQRDALFGIVRESPVLMRTLRLARGMGLPDWWLVSGAIYNQVWNHLTCRADMHGVKDIDLFYFDPDLTYAAEDRVIRRAAAIFPPKPPIELRNQARVHLWYPDHFGTPYPQLHSSAEGIDRFAALTHCVGLRLEADDALRLYAPYGLDDIFAFRVVPNTAMPNRETHERKAARQKAIWPELEVVPWPE